MVGGEIEDGITEDSFDGGELAFAGGNGEGVFGDGDGTCARFDQLAIEVVSVQNLEGVGDPLVYMRKVSAWR